jgi:hypothetical protein
LRLGVLVVGFLPSVLDSLAGLDAFIEVVLDFLHFGDEVGLSDD